jgi:hypothetical protein
MPGGQLDVSEAQYVAGRIYGGDRDDADGGHCTLGVAGADSKGGDSSGSLGMSEQVFAGEHIMVAKGCRRRVSTLRGKYVKDKSVRKKVTVELLFVWLPAPHFKFAGKYLMHLRQGKRFLYDYWDCGGVRHIFPWLKKNRITKVTMTTELGWKEVTHGKAGKR